MAPDKGWYQSDLEPRHPWRRPPRRTLAGDLASGWRRFRSMRGSVQLAIGAFADEQTQAPNTRHAERFRQAVADARNANRGMWSACSPATTAAATTVASTPRPVASPVTSPVTAVAAPTSTAVVTTTSAACHPSYAGVCLPVVSDVDCTGGSGDGPHYTSAKRFRVVGPDVYGLDRDGDGIACET